jgi:putative aminopeptidase FrvX
MKLYMIIIVLIILTITGCTHSVENKSPRAKPEDVPQNIVIFNDPPTEQAKPIENPEINIKTSSVTQIVNNIDKNKIVAHIKYLSEDIGVRREGTPAEQNAANYIEKEFQSLGYAVKRDKFDLINGTTSANVWVEIPGKSPEYILVGAHYDSKSPSPGANDNGSGVAVVLELARVLKNAELPYGCILVAFGSEEMIDANSDHHHYGSRFMASDSSFREKIHSANSVDMVGVGSAFWVHNLGKADDSWRDYVVKQAQNLKLPVKSGVEKPQSDHEAFENYGIPVAWIHWRTDNKYHTAEDKYERLNPQLLYQTTELLVKVIMEAK